MKKQLLSLLLAGVCAVSCNNAKTENPLLAEWDTPYGIPPFEQIKPEHYMPAFLEAMAQEKAEIDAEGFSKQYEQLSKDIEALRKAKKSLLDETLNLEELEIRAIKLAMKKAISLRASLSFQARASVKFFSLPQRFM